MKTLQFSKHYLNMVMELQLKLLILYQEHLS